MICPYCSHHNLDGLDHCDECLHDLSFFDVPRGISGLQQHLMEDTVSQVHFDRLVFVKPHDSVAHAISRIKTIGIGQAVVVKDERLVGILTERDLLYKVAGRDVDLNRIPVSEVMTSDPETVEEGDAIRVVVNKMAVGGYRHVPIVRQGHPVGIVSAKAVANCILEHSELDF
ncbi:MAG TPA: CBS domain-containing protein [Blastocatellia bacterium]|nr:CBS domain-containing protein [Blastocatellia bacterium]